MTVMVLDGRIDSRENPYINCCYDLSATYPDIRSRIMSNNRINCRKKKKAQKAKQLYASSLLLKLDYSREFFVSFDGVA